MLALQYMPASVMNDSAEGHMPSHDEHKIVYP